MHICKVTDYLFTEKKLVATTYTSYSSHKMPTCYTTRMYSRNDTREETSNIYKCCTEILEVILCIYVRLLTIYLLQKINW
jgi:hypothetical protein